MLRKISIYFICVTLSCMTVGCSTMSPERERDCLIGAGVGALVAGDIPSFRIDQMPYGGVKDSGLGREGLRYAIEEMTEPKLLVMNLR